MNTSNQLICFPVDPQLQEEFLWKTRFDEFIPPRNMETRHLYYTLQMIWNHAMPEDVRIKPYKQYAFDDFYTTAYMQSAICVIGNILLQRDNLDNLMIRRLKFMASQFREKPVDKLRRRRLTQ